MHCVIIKRLFKPVFVPLSTGEKFRIHTLLAKICTTTEIICIIYANMKLDFDKFVRQFRKHFISIYIEQRKFTLRAISDRIKYCFISLMYSEIIPCFAH